MLEVAQWTSPPRFPSLSVKEWGPCFAGFSSISQLRRYAFVHKVWLWNILENVWTPFTSWKKMISITFELPSIKGLVLNNLNTHSTVKHTFLKVFFQFGSRLSLLSSYSKMLRSILLLESVLNHWTINSTVERIVFKPSSNLSTKLNVVQNLKKIGCWAPLASNSVLFQFCDITKVTIIHKQN
jgi:hypothetical protein